MVRTLCFHSWSLGSNPGQGTKILQAMQCIPLKKKGLQVLCEKPALSTITPTVSMCRIRKDMFLSKSSPEG